MIIALNAYRKKLEKYHISELTEHMKVLEQTVANSRRSSRQKKTIKLRAKINKIEAKKKQY